MNRRLGTAAGVPAVLAVVLISACGDAGADVKVARAAFCEDLAAFRTSVAQISIQANLSAPGTVEVGDIRDGRDGVAAALDDVRASASQVQEALVEGLQAAYDDLSGAVEAKDDDTTLEEARTELAARKAEFLAAWQQVAGLAGCSTS